MPKATNKGIKVVYPPACKEITDDIGKDETVRRLKAIARALQEMAQEENSQYGGLALHLGSEYFLDHASKDVRLLVACCIADVFRIFAPEAPYRDSDQLKEIFLFLVKQLGGLEDPTSASFKRYFYLLENLAWVKSFNICIELEDNQEIFCSLFKLMFSIVNDAHSVKVTNFMLDMMVPLITEADNVSQELLDLILVNIVEPNKTHKKRAYTMARDLLRRTSSAIEPYIQAFFNNALMLGKPSESDVSDHIYQLIYELNTISPSMLLAVLPQLEFKLKSNEEAERKSVTRLLAKMFSEQNSELVSMNKPLWNCFLGRFNDISTGVRTTCVQSAQYFILFHPAVLQDITEQLKHRQHDPEELVRVEVISAILGAAKKDFSAVTDELLGFIKERTLDKKFRVRRDALLGLAQLYKRIHSKEPNIKSEIERVNWVRDKVFHTYYQNNVDDRLLVERIFNTCLIPYTLVPIERMKKMFIMYASLDQNAVKAFSEMLKHQTSVRNTLRQLVDVLVVGMDGKPPSLALVTPKLLTLSRQLPESAKPFDNLKKFSQIVYDDRRIRGLVKLIVSQDCTCKRGEDAVKEILKKVGNPTPQNFFYTTVKALLERTSPIMWDKNAVHFLVQLIGDSILGIQDITHGIHKAPEKGLELLKVLSMAFPHCFCSNEIYDLLLTFLKHEDDVIVDVTLQLFKNTGQSIESLFPCVYSDLLVILQNMARMGSPCQAKHAVQCISVMSPNKEELLAQIFDHAKKSLHHDSANYLTSIVVLGHIAHICPEEFAVDLKSIVSKVIVKDLLMQDRTTGIDTDESWYADHLVTEETQAKVQAMKLLVRWLLGLKDSSSKSGASTLRLFHTVIKHDGDLMERLQINKPELARLRLQAGCCMLKIAEEQCYSDVITREQFQALALLINDRCYEVRYRFASKLHKGLLSMKLSLEYMSIYSLAANDPMKERRTQVKQFLTLNINKRREYLKQNPGVGNRLFSILPDYVLPYTIHLLAHDPDLKTFDDLEALKNIKECMWFILDSLISKNDDYNYNFFRRMIENIKHSKDVQGANDDEMNKKMYAVCDVALGLVMTKTTNFTLKESVAEPVLPSKLFTKPDQNYINTASYLPKDFHFDAPKNKNEGVQQLIPRQYSGDTTVSGPGRPVVTTTLIVESPGPIVNVLPHAPRPRRVAATRTVEVEVGSEVDVEVKDEEEKEASKAESAVFVPTRAQRRTAKPVAPSSSEPSQETQSSLPTTQSSLSSPDSPPRKGARTTAMTNATKRLKKGTDSSDVSSPVTSPESSPERSRRKITLTEKAAAAKTAKTVLNDKKPPANAKTSPVKRNLKEVDENVPRKRGRQVSSEDSTPVKKMTRADSPTSSPSPKTTPSSISPQKTSPRSKKLLAQAKGAISNKKTAIGKLPLKKGAVGQPKITEILSKKTRTNIRRTAISNGTSDGETPDTQSSQSPVKDSPDSDIQVKRRAAPRMRRK